MGIILYPLVTTEETEQETGRLSTPFLKILFAPKLVKAATCLPFAIRLRRTQKLTKTLLKEVGTETGDPRRRPWTMIFLSAKTNNFLFAVHFDEKRLGISFVDISTGEFLTFGMQWKNKIDKLLQEFSPKRGLVSQSQLKRIPWSIWQETFHTFFYGRLDLRMIWPGHT